MLPRKRHRPNPAAVSSSSLPTTALSPETSLSRASTTSDQTASDQQKPSSYAENKSLNASSRVKEIRKTSSWYGSWPRPPKASASTSIAKENILGGTVKTKGSSDLSRFDPKKSDDALSVYSQMESGAPPTKESSTAQTGPSISVEAAEDKASSSTSQRDMQDSESRPTTTSSPVPESKPLGEQQLATKPELPVEPRLDSVANETSTRNNSNQSSFTAQKQAVPAAWLGWLYNTPARETTKVNQDLASEPPRQEEPVKPSTPKQKSAADQEPVSIPAPAPTPAPQTSSAWFGLWPATPSRMKPASADATSKIKSSTSPPTNSNMAMPSVPSPSNQSSNTLVGSERQPTMASEDVIMDDAGPEPSQVKTPPPKAGSTWAFWSRDSPKKKGKAVIPESGQIAVIGEGSEAQPSPMAEVDVPRSPEREIKEEQVAKDVQPSAVSTWRRTKRLRPLSMEIDVQRPSSAGSTKSAPTEPDTGARSSRAAEQPQETVKTPTKTDTKKKGGSGSTKKVTVESETIAKEPPNLLLPSFTSTYHMKENLSIIRQITNLVLRNSDPLPKHVYRVNDPPKIQKAIAIGVHGLFPAAYLRPMIGQPTGTSLRFASLCADAIRRWSEKHGCSDCEIEKVALEGEGRIGDRVDNLWKLMLNWVEHIRQADLIIIACHSQGVPVSIMLLEKLIDLGIVSRARIGVCAMAGVALGPFPDYKSSILMGSAAELWEFGNPQSSNSKRFEISLKRVIDYGARITFIGSIDDQLVPMESAVYSPANHPYIFRAVFIDGRVHAPDFISHLVGFALKLRNLGISDHGLVRELSAALAGSLYGGEGHSRLYYDAAVYDLAVMHALETTDTAKPTPCEIPNRETAPLAPSNPYVLPWIMRGLLEEDFVKSQLSAETEKLLQQFDDWKPTNKALKDVKYRLEAVRSKL